MSIEDGSRTRVLRLLAPLRQQDWLGLMLLGLQATLAFGIESPISKAFLLSHFGCFLLWQPVWRGGQKLYPGQLFFILAAAAVLVTSESWWLIALWTCVLFALIGGEVPGIKNVRQRAVALIAATYLLSILLIWVVPHLFPDGEYSPLVATAIRYGPLPLLALVFLIKTERPAKGAAYSVDLVYSMLLFLLVVVLVLGAFVIRELNHGNYVVALAQALLVAAGILLALGWLWDPRGNFAGIGQLMNRYLMSVGMPFERWMHNLAHLADQERDPDRFVESATQAIAALPWISGIDWQTGSTRGMSGHITRYPTEARFGALRLVLYTRWSPSPTLVLHIRLLARLLGDYYEAKQREHEQRQNAYMHAIYETGSRLTHDVKNLLQSIGSLCSAVEASSEADAPSLRRLLQRQLPQITQRLQGTLDKLGRRPDAPVELGPALRWWQSLRQRHGHEGLRFVIGNIPADAQLPLELFDSIAENLLQNAFSKKRRDPGLTITVNLTWSGAAGLAVGDDGSPVPNDVAARLFVAAVPSANGLGVGLYQAARLAEGVGYKLSLAANEPGNVVFALTPATYAVIDHGQSEAVPLTAASRPSPSG